MMRFFDSVLDSFWWLAFVLLMSAAGLLAVAFGWWEMSWWIALYAFNFGWAAQRLVGHAQPNVNPAGPLHKEVL